MHPLKSGVTLAEEEAINRSLFLKYMRLVDLAPDIVEALWSDPSTFDVSVKKIFFPLLSDAPAGL